jgi:DNA-binding NtrC family response regulator
LRIDVRERFMIKVLVVDDEELMCNSLYLHLKEEGYQAFRAYSGNEALDFFEKNTVDIVITDLRLGDIDGIELIKRVKEKHDNIYFIVMTAFGTMEKALEAGKLGVFHFITKPFSMEQINSLLSKIKENIELKIENSEYKKILGKRYEFSNIIGKCESMQKIFDIIEKVATIDVTVLITGESGTGKELVANAIHYNSLRKNKPLVKINCSALPENLLESELFGYEKGAFTGADKNHKGRFELAENGTIFLDEIGDMQLNLQAKILRVLQNKTIEPLGSAKTVNVNARVIAATNHDLEKKVDKQEFREDLFYRLNVVNIKLPPLRERTGDIEVLSDYMIKKFNQEFNRNIKGISREVLKEFLKYGWPGNIRELENVIQHGIIFSESDIIDIKDLPVTFNKKHSKISSGDKSLEGVEKQHIFEILEETSHNISKAAKILGIDRKTLYNKMAKYGFSERQKQ